MNDLIALSARPTRDDRSARLGMIVFIAGWTMMFGALLVTYALLRQSAPRWPPPGVPRIELGLPTVATAVLAASSVTMQLGLHCVRQARTRALELYLIATLVLALIFLSLQTTSWVHMLHRGLSPTGSLYAAAFFGLTLFHALHVATGVVGLGTLLPRAHRGSFNVREHTAVRSWTSYWHFVGIVWLALFAAVYLW